MDEAPAPSCSLGDDDAPSLIQTRRFSVFHGRDK